MTSFPKVLTIGAALLTLSGAVATSSTPAQAREGGAIAAGVLGGLAVGAIAGSAAANSNAYYRGGYGYAPPRTVYVEPAYAPPPPPPRCHRELVRFWDEDEGAYIERPRRVCDRY